MLICSELSLASALRTLAIVSEVDNKNADKWSELLRRPFLSDYAHYLSLVGIILDSPYDLDLALEKDLMSISRSSFMPLRELSDFVHNPENEDELLKSMTADELFYLQQLIGSPESRRQISNLLIRSIRSSITECCSVKIETWCSEIKRPNLTESGLEFCLDQISLTIKKVGGLNVLSSSLREKLESAGITALSKISVSISSSGNEENSHFLLKQLNISLQIGGSIPDSKKTLFQKFIINEIKLRERDPLWGLWSTPERFQIELDNISRLLNCISSFFSRSEGLKELNKVELLIKKLKKGIQTFEEYPKSKFLT